MQLTHRFDVFAKLDPAFGPDLSLPWEERKRELLSCRHESWQESAEEVCRNVGMGWEIFFYESSYRIGVGAEEKNVGW